MATKQTIASAKYQTKAGLISKSYKLKKELTDDFALACRRADISQSAQLTRMMSKFIEDVMEE